MTAQPNVTPPTSDLGISIEDLYRLNVEQYHAIADAGILDEDDPVELLEGWLVCKYGPFDAPPPRRIAPPDAAPAEEELGLSLAWIWRFRVDRYHAMIDAGILTEDEPVELLGGWLIRKMPQTPPHPIAVDRVRDAFARRLSPPWYVRTQAPITLPEGEPEPDLALVRGDRRDYLQRHPGPDDVALVVEVADTSPARDRGIKQQMYAQAGIPAYWIVNLPERKIERYAEPSVAEGTPDYTQRRDYELSDTIPVVLDGVEVGRLEVGELLP